MKCFGGPLDGQDHDGIGAFFKLPQYDGRVMVGWDEGPIYDYPEHIYRRSRDTWQYVGLVSPDKRTFRPA